MKIDILTLFPEMFNGILGESIIKKAIDNNKVKVNLINFRDYSKLSNKQVDDTIYGGGPGMLLRCEPIFECIDDINKDKDAHIVLLSPEGTKYNEKKAKEFTNYNHLIIICGHYEGFDERIKTLADEIISIGDYVLTGGEIPAMAIIDSTVRLLDGVINKESYTDDSFENGLLDYPVYTHPVSYKGLDVPDVLLSGHHENIRKWRLEEQIKRTKLRRPDLLEKRD